MVCNLCGCTSEFDNFGERICGCDACMTSGCTHYYTIMQIYAIKKIMKWWKSIPACRCGVKPKINDYHLCELCLHAKYMDDCMTCQGGHEHVFRKGIQHRWNNGEW